jgi:hypothetical protein
MPLTARKVVERLEELTHEIKVKNTELSTLLTEFNQLKPNCPHPLKHRENAGLTGKWCDLCQRPLDPIH